MFQRFNAMKERREGGFTLIELLVVILIIAILAAIAIPVFLNQRKKGWVSQMESAVKNAATAAESYATGQTAGNYAGIDETDLTTEGWRKASLVTATAVLAYSSDQKYCVTVTHTNLNDATKQMGISSDITAPARVGGPCTGTGLPAVTDWQP